MEKFLIANRIMTPDGTILWSRFGHDYVRYTDANGIEYMLDGGTDYQRAYDERNLPEEQKSKDLCVYSDDDFEVIRQVMLRGTFDKNNKRIWVPLYKLNNAHLAGILDYNETNGIKSRFEQFIVLEMTYRKIHNIFIADGPYDPEDGVESINKPHDK